jgi:hypothetical protein
MRITLRRTGGFSGATLTASIDTAELSQKDAARLEKLAEGANPGRSSPPAPKSADDFQYDIEITGPRGQRMVSFREWQMTPGLQALVELLTELARKKK